MTKEFNRIVRSWKPHYEVWPFVYGNDLLGILNGINGSFFMHGIRKELKLRPYAPFTCYFPVATIGYVVTDLIHSQYITKKVLQTESCTLCTVTTGAILQASMGVAYPLILSPLLGFYMADRLLTYPVPSINRAPKEVFRLWLKMVTRNPRFVINSVILQLIAASYVTVEKQKFFWNFLEGNLSK
ncbi:uncharacterized protein TNIN_271331 [Trichonephila inaurata madagascariensis]|uniref:Uncharacterized protein n=1 Tax=Trichonephila inaurata madagascariensis TaxID=2747483 RepID=A0A8X6YH41_9ARAC|nr:uncharacterized protein TNIN_271331 [Trichonephila inaurata madagascariensis]